MNGNDTNNGDKKMNAAQLKLIADTKIILADLEAIGTDEAAATARQVIARTYEMLGSYDLADLIAALAA